MMRRMGTGGGVWRMDGYYISLSRNPCKRAKLVAPFRFSPGRVTTEHVQTQRSSPSLYDRAYVTNSYYTKREIPQIQPIGSYDGGKHILRHRRSVASGSIPDYDVIGPTPREVNMVEPNCSRGHNAAA